MSELDESDKPCQPVVIIDNIPELQDPKTTLADLRLSFPKCYLTSIENGKQVTHRASAYELVNQVYVLHIPPSTSSDSASTEKKSVRFHFTGLPVTHWDHQVKRIVPVDVDAEDPVKAFKYQLFTIFTEEITTQDIRIYALPVKFKSYDERRNVETKEEFLKIVEQYVELDPNRPLIFVYNYKDDSPKKAPAAHIDPGEESVDLSHFTEESNVCKETAGNTCLFCGLSNLAGVGLQGCHIYQREKYKQLKDKKAKISTLDEFLISHIHQQNNFICLCTKCHSKFDAYLICIHPAYNTLMISPTIRNELTGSGFFIDHHGKSILFPGKEHRRPTLPLIQYRHNEFLKKHKSIQTKESSKKININKELKFHCCCFCIELFSTVDEADHHIRSCALAGKMEGVMNISEK